MSSIIRIELVESNELFKNTGINLILLERLENSALTLDDLASKVGLSKFSVSRSVKVLKSAHLIGIIHTNKKTTVSISGAGK